MQQTAPPKIKQDVRDNFEPEPFVSAISTPDLTPAESSLLLECINAVRSGEKMFYVRLGHVKTGKGRSRIAGVDYEPDPTLSSQGHEGWLYAAPTNKKRTVYLRLKDEARAKPDQEVEIDPETGKPIPLWDYTCATLFNLFAFKVFREAPGPLGVVPVAATGTALAPATQQRLLSEAFQAGMTMQASVEAAQNPNQSPA